MRPLGWLVALLLFALALVADWFVVPAEPAGPTTEQLAAFANLEAEQAALWVREFSESIRDPKIPQQVFLAFAPPGETPLIVISDSVEDDAESWPVPWPKIAERLRDGLAEPDVVSDSFNSLPVRSWIYPIPASDGSRSTQYLLINRWTLPGQRPAWFGLRGTALLLGVLLAIGLFATRE